MVSYTKEELELLESIENDKLQSVEFDNDTIKKEAKKTQEDMKQKKEFKI